MELLHFDGGRQGGTAALALGTADAFRRADPLDVSGGEQFQNALVETEVADWILNLSVLDEPHAIARQSGEQRRPRINTADVPEAAHQQAALRGLDHLFDAVWFRGAFQYRVHRPGRWFLSLFFRPVARVGEVFQNAVADKINFPRHGVLENLTYSRYWAKEKGKEPTPGPVNTILESSAKPDSVEEMIKATERGLLVSRFWY